MFCGMALSVQHIWNVFKRDVIHVFVVFNIQGDQRRNFDFTDFRLPSPYLGGSSFEFRTTRLFFIHYEIFTYDEISI